MIKLKLLKARLFERFFKDNEVFYVNGSENLPPPLTKQEEEEVFVSLEQGDEKCRERLVIHNLRAI